MAQILNTANHLEHDLDQLSRQTTKDGIIGLLLFFMGPLTHIIVPFILPLIFWFFGAKRMFRAIKSAQKVVIIKSGLQGERASMEVFKGLSDDYSVISDIEIETEGKKSQIDNVIVGPNGIFVVETKNLKGEIIGDASQATVKQNKVGRNGGEYSRTLYNPIKQVNTHVYRLSILLKENNIHHWIQGIVYFSHQEADVYLESESTPVFSYKDDGVSQLLQYITAYNKQKISTEEQEKIISEVSRYIISR